MKWKQKTEQTSDIINLFLSNILNLFLVNGDDKLRFEQSQCSEMKLAFYFIVLIENNLTEHHSTWNIRTCKKNKDNFRVCERKWFL